MQNKNVLINSFSPLSLSVCSYTVRIESMLLKEDFPAACEAMKRDIKILRAAIKGNTLAASAAHG